MRWTSLAFRQNRKQKTALGILLKEFLIVSIYHVSMNKQINKNLQILKINHRFLLNQVNHRFLSPQIRCNWFCKGDLLPCEHLFHPLLWNTLMSVNEHIWLLFFVFSPSFSNSHKNSLPPLSEISVTCCCAPGTTTQPPAQVDVGTHLLGSPWELLDCPIWLSFQYLLLLTEPMDLMSTACQVEMWPNPMFYR